MQNAPEALTHRTNVSDLSSERLVLVIRTLFAAIGFVHNGAELGPASAQTVASVFADGPIARVTLADSNPP
ncbi:hypothetical protein [Chelatococcus asaccharovorans]|uniref:Uncharacterized protein n=1 Tax=Chelatococcus asaccharovorans TaxID=28210 RepID=A0A2V3U9H3_9HYPH|nr:hypothetical protein [Chelatococcus asaccharovorans]MBS7705472.1 hypothetical protein [Chelatococcus asaccharovorans]PXW60123.1 hypothetical protein C7450_104175 [Chelatococcus asaccharovorans]CAH1655791.1 conserved hypothetical protein [Chelatococcus asaccharovorans]CAH1685307.1 conserved hypothetical protein [Chelatococcus asaccharovorans]